MSTTTRCGPAYRIHTRRLVLRCREPGDAPLLMAAIAANLEHLRPWLLWAQHEPEDLQAKIERLRQYRGAFDLGQDYFYGLFNYLLVWPIARQERYEAEGDMNDRRLRLLAPGGLVIGAVLGMAGTFVLSPSLRGLLWGLDGIALIIATALLMMHHLRQGHDTVAAGFLVFVAGETLILAGAAMDLEASGPVFGAGVGLWAASLTLVSAPNVMPSWVRVVAAVAALLFTVVAVQIFIGLTLTPLSRPLPFFAYPFLAATLFGWAWVHYRNAP